MFKNKKFVSIASSIIACFMLVSCGKKGPDLGPSAYEILGEDIPSLNNMLDGEGGVFESVELPSDEGEDDDSNNTAIKASIYHYHSLPELGQTIGSYVDELTTQDPEFAIINVIGQKSEAPDFTTESGTVILSKPNLDLRESQRMIIRWEADTCSITVYVTSTESNNSDLTAVDENSEESNPSPLAAEEAVNYLKGLSTTVLDLPGDSMDAYNVYFLDGKAMVNGMSCLRLRVYEISPPEGSNAILATYLLSGDKSRLYRLNMESNQVEELTLP